MSHNLILFIYVFTTCVSSNIDLPALIFGYFDGIHIKIDTYEEEDNLVTERLKM